MQREASGTGPQGSGQQASCITDTTKSKSALHLPRSTQRPDDTKAEEMPERGSFGLVKFLHVQFLTRVFSPPINTFLLLIQLKSRSLTNLLACSQQPMQANTCEQAGLLQHFFLSSFRATGFGHMDGGRAPE